MKCVLCKNGETHAGSVTTTLTRGETVVVVRAVPAEVCENCGDYYLSSEVSRHILEIAEEAVRHGAEVEILRYAA
jgi:YgiT-type zinc finger domain-containing protein